MKEMPTSTPASIAFEITEEEVEYAVRQFVLKQYGIEAEAVLFQIEDNYGFNGAIIHAKQP